MNLLKFFCIFIFFLASELAAQRIELSNISTQRLAGQMILVGFSGTNKNDYLVKKLGQEASLGKLSGVVFRAQNLKDLEQGRLLIERFANIAVANPLLLALDASELSADFEHLKSPDFSHPKEPLEQARINYLKSALELYGLGFNAYFGADLSANIANEDLSRLSIYAQLHADSLAQANLARFASYFPGIAHSEIAGSSAQRFYLDWLRPFYDLVATSGAEIIIVSNKIIRAIDPLRPAAQSPKIMRILREDLGFSGLVASADILGGDLDEQDFAQRIINSINAGCDLLYFSQSLIKSGDTASAVVDIIAKAVRSGQISRERLEQSYLKITELKSKIRKRAELASAK